MATETHEKRPSPQTENQFMTPQNHSVNGPQAGYPVENEAVSYGISNDAVASQNNQEYPPPAWAANVVQGKAALPSLIFAIPFPEPVSGIQKTKKTPLFLLYSFPRANYVKPPVGENGKRGKEGLIKKVERKWQEEVKEGQDIKQGKLEDPSSWKRFKGAVIRSANRLIKWLPDSNIETLGRLPPGKKIGVITIVYPDEHDEVSGSGIERQPNEIDDGLNTILRRTRQRSVAKTTLSAFLLPITAAIDFFCIVPLFLFEINLAYFAIQVNGARKVGTITKAKKKAAKRSKVPRVPKKGLKAKFRRRPRNAVLPEGQVPVAASPSPLPPSQTPERAADEVFRFEKCRQGVFQPALSHLYSLCSQEDPGAFPRKPQEGYEIPPLRANRTMVIGLIGAFKESVPAELAMRHNLDPDVVAKDLGRCMKKGVKEYMKTLK